MLTEEVVCSYLQRQSPSKNEESHGLRGKDVSGFFRRKGNGGFRHGSPFLSSLIDYPSRKGQNRLHSHHPHKTIPSKAVPSKRKIRKLIVQGETQESRPWHVMDSDALLEDFGTGKIVGLSSEAARERLKRYGPNILPEAVPRSSWAIFVEQFKSYPVAFLSVAAVISLLTGGAADAFIIMSVVLINAGIGYATQSQTERIIFSLKSIVRPTALVKREGRILEIGAEEVVPGDLLSLRPGSYIAADARLLEVHLLSVDESALTGESMPIMKRSSPLGTENVPLADRTNMVYMGTLATGGQAMGVAVATGKFSEIGRVQLLVGQATSPETPLEKQLRGMGTQLGILSGAICALVFFMGLLRGYGALKMLQGAISLAVAAIPEGLPAVATTTLALGVRNMERRRALIRHLEAVETLGSVQVICLDKTGTLTMNSMRVETVHVGMCRMAVIDHRFMAGGKEVDPHPGGELLMLIEACTLCNESEVSQEQTEYRVNGSPTENALIHMAIGAGVDVISLRQRWPMYEINHRSEKRNFMATLHQRSDSPHRMTAVKGSPTEVLSLCGWHLHNGNRIQLTEEDRQTIEGENEQMAGEALRVLGIAYAWDDSLSVTSDEGTEPGGSLIWLGLVGMGDPLRPGVREVVKAFHRAGIDTIMITGDQTPTAYAIARQMDLSRHHQIEILDSTNLADIDPEALRVLSERVNVFSRVSPAHKLQIVYALQRAGKVVAMTGDGINDGPALKAADIGIAMGHAGTDVAREVADVILQDDNLETMVIAVSQGRTIYSNIRKDHPLPPGNESERGLADVVGHGLWAGAASESEATSMDQPHFGCLSRPGALP